MKKKNDKTPLQECVDNDWDWTYLYQMIHLKIKKMAHSFKKDLFHDNKDHIREMWKISRVLRKVYDEWNWWPQEFKIIDNEYVWFDRHKRNTGIRTKKRDVLKAEQMFFEMQLKQFTKLMAKYSRAWWI